MILRASLILADAEETLFAPGALRLDADSGRILEAGPAAQLAAAPGEEVLDVGNAWIIPGLVQAHIHFSQTLFRGLAEGVELLPWLKDRIWPLEAAHDMASVRASARQTIAELLLSGATAALTLETSHHSEAVFECCHEMGLRAVIGPALMDFSHKNIPPRLVRDGEEALAEVVELHRAWSARSGGRVRACIAPRFVLSCTEELLLRSAETAKRHNLIWHTHASENDYETQKVRSVTGHDNVAYFEHLGILGENCSLAHGIWLTDEEISLLAERRAALLHCPSTNLKLGSGVANTPAMHAAGVPVAIGSDGAPANNRLDIFEEMRLAGLLSQWKTTPGKVKARDVFGWATAGGAKALGMAREIGVLTKGACADFVVLEPGLFCGSPKDADAVYTHLVFSASSCDVRDTWVGGKQLVKHRRLVHDSESEIAREYSARRREVLARL
jgi:5-methylthioadenosine/S-adenosylhomocysteine deaminase